MNVTLLFILTLATQFAVADFSGDLGAQVRAFNGEGLYTSSQEQFDASFYFEPEYTISWNNDRENFTFKVFARVDSADEERTHFDLRQLDWTKSTNQWEFRVGVRKVFWGVTESMHLVDVINQTDQIENFDGEQKLGQPMLNIAWVKDFGTFDFYILPYFRERTFPGKNGRFRFALPFSKEASYESRHEEEHVDGAFRWAHTLGNFDLGLSYFNGTSREPRYVLGSTEIAPFYDLIEQTGLDIQWTFNAWLWKLEAVHRTWNPNDYVATAFGFEYTFSNVKNMGADLGFIMEYLTDNRSKINLTTPFENDIFVGARLALNDEDDLQILAGVIQDLKYSSHFLNIEASRRIGSSIQITLESRAFLNIDSGDGFVKNIENESYTQLEVTYSF